MCARTNYDTFFGHVEGVLWTDLLSRAENFDAREPQSFEKSSLENSPTVQRSISICEKHSHISS